MTEYMAPLNAKANTITPGTGKVTIRSSVHPNDLGQLTAIRYDATHEDGRSWVFWADNPGAFIRSLGYTVEYSI